jgi:peroxin-1
VGIGRSERLTRGPQVNISLHIDPPLAHTVNIEPLTATDWESKSSYCLVDLDG